MVTIPTGHKFLGLFLWSYLKDRFYKNLYTIQELRITPIHSEIKFTSIATPTKKFSVMLTLFWFKLCAESSVEIS